MEEVKYINNKEESSTSESKDKIVDEVAKITISRDAEGKLIELLKRTNDGFLYGRVNRQELASWIILKFVFDVNDEVIDAIRRDHFNELLVLESILKQGKEDGKLPTELQGFLRQQLGISQISKAKAKRP